MDKFELRLAAAALVGAASLGWAVLSPPALAQVSYQGVAGQCERGANPEACARDALDTIRPKRGLQAVDFTLWAADGFLKRGNLCEGLRFSELSIERGNQVATGMRGSQAKAAAERVTLARLYRGMSFAQLAADVARGDRPACVTGRDEAWLLSEAQRALSPPPGEDSPFYTRFLWERAQAAESAGGIEGQARAKNDYETIVDFATRNPGAAYATDAGDRLRILTSARCTTVTDLSASLESVRSAVAALANERNADPLCLGNGYLRLADGGATPEERRRDYSAALNAFGGVGGAKAAEGRGKARLGLATLPGADVERLYREAVGELALASARDQGNGQLKLLLGKARVGAAGATPRFDRAIVQIFEDAASLLRNADPTTAAEALVAAGEYVASTGGDGTSYFARANAMAAGSPLAAVRLAEAAVKSGESISSRALVLSAAQNASQPASLRATAYYVLAADSIGVRNWADAQQHADSALSFGMPDEKYRSLACLAHVRADLGPGPRGQWRPEGPRPLCGGTSAEAKLLAGLYSLALVRYIEPNTREGATEIARARVAFAEGLQARSGLESAPTFAPVIRRLMAAERLSLNAPLTVKDLLMYGQAQAEACLGPDASSGLDPAKREVAKNFITLVGATCK